MIDNNYQINSIWKNINNSSKNKWVNLINSINIKIKYINQKKKDKLVKILNVWKH
jgi:hypothetical protein